MKQSLLLFAILLCHSTYAQFQDGLDPTFGNSGITRIANTTHLDDYRIYDAILQTDNKIVTLTGRKIIRLNSNGSIDSSFGSNGFFADTFKSADGSILDIEMELKGIKLQPDGKMVITANIYKSIHTGDYSILLFRVLYNGKLDNTFGTNGLVAHSTSYTYSPNTLAIKTDGKIIVSGNDYHTGNAILIRYSNTGVVDSTFGTNGIVQNIAGTIVTQNDIEILSDGRILQMLNHFKVARYLPDGALDTSFNHTGIAAITPIASSASYYSNTHAMCLAPDGKVWLAGITPYPAMPSPFTIGRINTDGSLDTSFNHVGYKDYTWDTSNQNECQDMLLLPDGTIILGGNVTNKWTKRENYGLLKILPNGIVDSSFGDNGKLLTQVYGSSIMPDQLYKLLLQLDDKLLAFGASSDSVINGYATTVRYLANGKTSISLYANNNNESIFTYPNPAQNTLYIYNPTAQKVDQISIYNLQGIRLLQTDKINTNSIDIGQLPAGLYLVAIHTALKKYYQKIAIQH